MKRPGAIPLLACHFLLFLQLVGVGYARQSATADWLPKLTLERIHKQGAFTGRFFEAGSSAEDGPRQWLLRPPMDDSGAPDIVLRDLVSGRDKRVVSGKELVDPDRIGIWGWSYGGYATLMALVGVEDSPFSMGVSVAPVTDWRLYDTIYTERYLGTPQSGPDAYAASSVIERADRLREDQHLLLIHGDADDNVHVEHTLDLAAALQQANRQFDIMIYPGRTHSLSGEGTRLHLFSMISRYIEANLVRTLEKAVPPRFAPE